MSEFHHHSFYQFLWEGNSSYEIVVGYEQERLFSIVGIK